MRIQIMIAVLALSGSAAAQERETPDWSSHRAIEESARLSIGSFTTRPQAERDERYGVVESEVVRIWPRRTDGVWLYQENAWLGDTPAQIDESAKARPYFQRIVHIGPAGETSVRRTTYRPADPDAVRGAWQDPAGFPEDGLGAQSCTGIAERIAYHYWVAEFDCPNAHRGAVRTISRSITTKGEYANWDVGLDIAGDHVWGPQAGGYVFTRIPPEEEAEE